MVKSLILFQSGMGDINITGGESHQLTLILCGMPPFPPFIRNGTTPAIGRKDPHIFQILHRAL